jgi:hypothetical protein
MWKEAVVDSFKARETEESYEQRQPVYLVSGLRFEPGASRTQNWNAVY